MFRVPTFSDVKSTLVTYMFVLVTFLSLRSLVNAKAVPAETFHSRQSTRLFACQSDEWNVAHATNLEEENKLIEAGFEYVRYSDKDEVTIYRKRN
jgi:hypothetical protein